MKILFLILLCILFPALMFAETDMRRVYLGEVDLAGLVAPDLPRVGAKFPLSDPEHALVDDQGNPLGYFPVLFRDAVAAMQAEGLPVHIEVVHHYASPRPGQFLRVIVWVDTRDLSLIQPLLYHIPIHAEEDLSDYE